MLQDELLAMEHHAYLWLKLIVDVIQDERNPTKRRLKRIINMSRQNQPVLKAPYSCEQEIDLLLVRLDATQHASNHKI